jgi:signal transduction histidine kinase
MIRVSVEDQGIGIEEEARKNLFQPFKQAQRAAGGTGEKCFVVFFFNYVSYNCILN